MFNLLAERPAKDRRIALALLAGVVAGIISALVKSGFETLIPPRTLSTTPPPVILLEKLGFNVDVMTYEWMGYSINWGGNGVHILFSMTIAIIYCLAVERFPRANLLHGIAFGVGVSVLAHGLVVPLMGLSGWLWIAGPEALISEFVGTAFWIWTIEAVRRDLRDRASLNRS
ncbi:YagU family protein [Pseudomonas sp. NPDC096917]|uniref:YagU family protein n=1 Tax=Pseudomonas sp. NPDC096917 TaxID=3364483 RepID=UPI00383A26EB